MLTEPRTGATGYIGGTVLSQLAESHPEYSIRALVRDEAKGKLITDAFKEVEVVVGDLDSADILAEEVANADVVVRESCNGPLTRMIAELTRKTDLADAGHLKSVETIHKAIASKPSTSEQQISSTASP